MSPAAPKICSSCSLANSAAKNYCDRCGKPLTQEGELPKTVVRKTAPPAAAEGYQLPAAGRAEFVPSEKTPTSPRTGSRSAAKTGPSRTGAKTTSRRTGAWKPLSRLAGPLLLLAAIAAGGAGVYRYQSYHKPENAIPRKIDAYLTALSRWDANAAYALLSPSSRANCALEEFQALQRHHPWSWSEVALVKKTGSAALVRYTALPEGGSPEPELLFLTPETGDWAVAFNLNLINDAHSALAGNNPDIAIMRAQAAVRVNGADPRAHAALCRAYRFRRLEAEARQQCELSAQLSESFGLPDHGGLN